jgi:hypothetical protein
VDTGSREENASKQEALAGPKGDWRQPPFRTGRFVRDRSPKDVMAHDRPFAFGTRLIVGLIGNGKEIMLVGAGGLAEHHRLSRCASGSESRAGAGLL